MEIMLNDRPAWRHLRRRLCARGGNMGPLMALMIVPIIGAMGMAVEGGNLYLQNRSMQNAADSAALAAAANNCTDGTKCGGMTFNLEAAATAQKYGFVNGASSVTVTPASGVACPAPSTATNCYRVTISRPHALSLLRIVGFAGNLGGSQTVAATAVARPRGNATTYCMMALGTGNKAFVIDGGPNVNLQGCAVYSNGDAKCNGNGAAPNFGISTSTVSSSGSRNECGATQTVDTTITDPFAARVSNITGACTGGVFEPPNAVWDLSANNSANPMHKCGVKLKRNTTITAAAPGSVLIIGNNADLNLDGFTLSATGGLTIVFTGATNKAAGFPIGSGTVDFRAPTTGAWSGVALYQDPRLKAGTDSYSGNSPTFKLTGLIYAPKSELTISGAINKSTAGLTCIGIIADNLKLNGQGAIAANATSQCVDAGLELPQVQGTGSRQALVL